MKFRFAIEVEISDDELKERAEECEIDDVESYANGTEASIEDSIQEALGHYENDHSCNLSVVILGRK